MACSSTTSSSSRLASIAASVSACSRGLSCIGVSSGSRTVARVAAIRCLGLCVGLQYTHTCQATRLVNGSKGNEEFESTRGSCVHR